MRQESPGVAANAATTVSRRVLKAALRAARKPWSPFSASTAAAWLIEAGFEVLCDWIIAIALINGSGPPAKPMRQPVMA